MITLALALALALAGAYEPPLEPWLERGIPHVESRGSLLAVSPVGARGAWQVMPRWSRVPAWALHLPGIGAWEGRRIWRWWERRCHASPDTDIEGCALRAYSCGVRGVRGYCGFAYAAAVRRAGGER